MLIWITGPDTAAADGDAAGEDGADVTGGGLSLGASAGLSEASGDGLTVALGLGDRLGDGDRGASFAGSADRVDPAGRRMPRPSPVFVTLSVSAAP
jgi:hypothetical protein